MKMCVPSFPVKLNVWYFRPPDKNAWWKKSAFSQPKKYVAGTQKNRLIWDGSFEYPQHNWWTWDFQQCGMCDQQRLRPACTYAQSDQSHCYSLEYSMSVKLLTEQHLEFLSLNGGCTGLSESTHVKMPYCWKSRRCSLFKWMGKKIISIWHI